MNYLHKISGDIEGFEFTTEDENEEVVTQQVTLLGAKIGYIELTFQSAHQEGFVSVQLFRADYEPYLAPLLEYAQNELAYLTYCKTEQIDVTEEMMAA